MSEGKDNNLHVAIVGTAQVSVEDIEALTQDVIQAAWLATSDDDVRTVIVNFLSDLLGVSPSVFDRD